MLPSPKRFVHLVKSLLMQGLTPAGISLSIALGFAGALFPILGTTSIICLLFAAAFKLNHTITQSINWLAAPVHLALIFPFMRIGERVFHADPVPLSLTQLISAFQQAPLGFLGRFSMSFVHAITGWLLTMPLAVLATYFILLVVLRRFTRRHPVSQHPVPATPA